MMCQNASYILLYSVPKYPKVYSLPAFRLLLLAFFELNVLEVLAPKTSSDISVRRVPPDLEINLPSVRGR